ncbi:MAG: TetR/AcrR family transcriptional regulator [Acidobacteriota bacterium]
MGYKHRREDILEAAVNASLEIGIGGLTFGRVAKRLDLPDRTIVYYFPNKEALIVAVIEAHSARLEKVLEAAFAQPARDHVDLLRMAWPVIASPGADPVFRIFFEIVGLATRGVAQFAQLVPGLMEAWIGALMLRLDLPDDARRAEAEAAVAVIDGLLLVRHAHGPEAADRAAARLIAAR